MCDKRPFVESGCLGHSVPSHSGAMWEAIVPPIHLSLLAVGHRALSLLESQQFPDLPVTTPTHLAHAPANLSLSALTWDNWEPYRKLLKPAWSALCEFTDFLYQEFEPQTHPEAFQALEDTLLLVESAGAICKIGVLGVDTWEVPSSSTGGTQ